MAWKAGWKKPGSAAGAASRAHYSAISDARLAAKRQAAAAKRQAAAAKKPSPTHVTIAESEHFDYTQAGQQGSSGGGTSRIFTSEVEKTMAKYDFSRESEAPKLKQMIETSKKAGFDPFAPAKEELERIKSVESKKEKEKFERVVKAVEEARTGVTPTKPKVSTGAIKPPEPMELFPGAYATSVPTTTPISPTGRPITPLDTDETTIKPAASPTGRPITPLDTDETTIKPAARTPPEQLDVVGGLLEIGGKALAIPGDIARGAVKLSGQAGKGIGYEAGKLTYALFPAQAEVLAKEIRERESIPRLEQLEKTVSPYAEEAAALATESAVLLGGFGLALKAYEGTGLAIAVGQAATKVKAAPTVGKLLNVPGVKPAAAAAEKIVTKGISTKTFVTGEVGGRILQWGGSAIQEPGQELYSSIHSKDLEGTIYETPEIKEQTSSAGSRTLQIQYGKLEEEKAQEAERGGLEGIGGAVKGFVLSGGPEAYFWASPDAQEEAKKTYRAELKASGLSPSEKEFESLYKRDVESKIVFGTVGMVSTEMGGNLVGAVETAALLTRPRTKGKLTALATEEEKIMALNAKKAAGKSLTTAETAFLGKSSKIKFGRSTTLGINLAAGSYTAGVGEDVFTTERIEKTFGLEKTPFLEKVGTGMVRGGPFASAVSFVGGAAIGLSPRWGSFLYLRGGQALDVPGEFLGDVGTDVLGLVTGTKDMFNVRIPIATPGAAVLTPTGDVKVSEGKKKPKGKGGETIENLVGFSSPESATTNGKGKGITSIFTPTPTETSIYVSASSTEDVMFPEPIEEKSDDPVPPPIDEDTDTDVPPPFVESSDTTSDATSNISNLTNITDMTDYTINESITVPTATQVPISLSFPIPTVTAERGMFPPLLPFGGMSTRRGKRTKLTYFDETSAAFGLLFGRQLVSGKRQRQSVMRGGQKYYLKKAKTKKKKKR